MMNIPNGRYRRDPSATIPTGTEELPWQQQGRRGRRGESNHVSRVTRQTFNQVNGKEDKNRMHAGRPAWRGGRTYTGRGGRGFARFGENETDRLAQNLGKLHLHPNHPTLPSDESKGEERSFRPIRIIRDAHLDDIHGFLSISPEHFVSGSKDCKLKMWNIDGSFVKELTPQVAINHRGYKYWITALTKLTESHWASGTRDGQMTIWDSNGKEHLAMSYNPSSAARGRYVCKDRNKARINCITPFPGLEPGRFFYTGTPKFIQLWDGWSERLVKYHKASDNDWVYCIEALENSDLLVVIGSKLEYWSMEGEEPRTFSLIQEEVAEHKAHQRPHISAIMRLEGNRDLLASALFDGSVKVVDIEAKQIVREYQEHNKRVWSVINLTPTLFASSADDRTIKIWDTRESRSIRTITGGAGRVSSLLRLSEFDFISGSCPDDLSMTTERANITFWDIRQI